MKRHPKFTKYLKKSSHTKTEIKNELEGNTNEGNKTSKYCHINIFTEIRQDAISMKQNQEAKTEGYLTNNSINKVPYK